MCLDGVLSSITTVRSSRGAPCGVSGGKGWAAPSSHFACATTPQCGLGQVLSLLRFVIPRPWLDSDAIICR